MPDPDQDRQPPIQMVETSAFLEDLPTVEADITPDYLTLRFLIDGRQMIELALFLPRPTDAERLASRIIGALNNRIVDVNLGRQHRPRRPRPARQRPGGGVRRG
jgi:hypothetical protein